jgi:membrane-bound metal-dependent hydrolase YbcI (DUF457 family)
MPNAATHQWGAALTVGAAVARHQYVTDGKVDFKALAAALLAGQLGSLPDLLEPALHPNHRGFFHSVTCLALVGYALYRLYRWEPEEPLEKLVKWLALIAGGAFATHLLMDATTSKSLPLV